MKYKIETISRIAGYTFVEADTEEAALEAFDAEEYDDIYGDDFIDIEAVSVIQVLK